MCKVNQNCLHSPVPYLCFFPLLAARRSKRPHLIAAAQGLQERGDGAEQRLTNRTQREEQRLRSQLWAPHICHEETRASPQCQRVRAPDGRKIKNTHFLLVIASKISLLGPIERQGYFCSVAHARKIAYFSSNCCFDC